MTQVLSVTSECVPLVKTGGLADVAGALPDALAPLGADLRTLLPGYRAVMAACGTAPAVLHWPDLMGGPARVLHAALGARALYVLDAPHLFDRAGSPYLDADGRDWPDNPRRFAALSLAAVRIAATGIEGWVPQVLHLHDWQAGLVPVYLAEAGIAGRVGTLMTVHNIAFQGLAPAASRGELGLPESGFTPEGYEYFGQISALKAGLALSDAITTVSPTYAAELMTPEFGMGLDGVLRHRQAHLSGVLNGIDTGVWGAPYKTPQGKRRHKAALRAQLGLPDGDGPLCVVVSRMSAQKGLDLLLAVAPALLGQGAQLAVLGSGDADLEKRFGDLAAHPGAAVRIGYDEALSHLMMAGGDAILVPSRFEPCGLTQLYGLAHGTLPVVARTGGLADTVIDANPAAQAMGVATGFQFAPVTAEALAVALSRMMQVWQAPDQWRRMQRNAMRQLVGWAVAAAEYARLYQGLVRN
ncbi:MAG: glycogen synthase GlgA [Rhodobacteraceae bacterium]|nr:glycogen synthase GlgA [Paracoccaceae bacterium]